MGAFAQKEKEENLMYFSTVNGIELLRSKKSMTLFNKSKHFEYVAYTFSSTFRLSLAAWFTLTIFNSKETKLGIDFYINILGLDFGFILDWV